MESQAFRPPGDLLQEILEKGPKAFLRVSAGYPSAPPIVRAALLLGGLSLGRDVDEQLHSLLSSPDSPAKQATLLGLGNMGHPLAEGYLARIVRERPAEEAVALALRGLGCIRGRKTFPLVLAALGEPAWAAQACPVLAAYGDPPAISALLEHAEEPAARRALADSGASAAQPLFHRLLETADAPLLDAVRWVGASGDVGSARHLVPLLAATDPELAQAAYAAYCELDAPLGPDPLLQMGDKPVQTWMVEALAKVSHPEIHGFLLDLLAQPASEGFIRRWFCRRRPSLDPRTIYRSLRAARSPDVTAALAKRLAHESDPVAVAEILRNRGILEDGVPTGEVLALWRRGGLLFRHLAAGALVQSPTAEFLAEAVQFLSQPALTLMDGVSAAADPARLIETYARDQNACLLVGDFLGSGLVDVGGLHRTLCQRFAQGDYPSAQSVRSRFGRPEDEGIPEFLGALAEAAPAMTAPLLALWSLLAQVEQTGEPVLNLFLSWTEVHRGGLRRSLARNLPGALSRFILGKTDRDLPQLESLCARLPQQGALAGVLHEMFDRSRRVLMAECRDIALMAEGQTRGDMVLVEAL